ncbi:hypothetical protein CTEN210_12878 [Chaetoceros tenuissimus]|uniref:Methyltransferase FkbM domain-containing protein n=1 Tax=Chaetoceros tenuissimus TaxID=426638 RepID=A0AAD3HAA0_9STRA|nr:hypothetical protein CTEN210_12878 [Chaetoceros tenuissimus]
MNYSKLLNDSLLLSTSYNGNKDENDEKTVSTKDENGNKKSKIETPLLSNVEVKDDDISQCTQFLVERKKAVMKNISLSQDHINFSILLHHPSIDSYITRKIMKQGTYEPEMEQFLSQSYEKHIAFLNKNATNMTNSNHKLWAVDIGANIGFHALHMASLGANVIAFEPAPDTYSLIDCSSKVFQRSHTKGSLTVTQAGASNVTSEAYMYRHPKSPGMTTFGSNSLFPLEKLDNASSIPIITAKSVLEQVINTQDIERLWMLKVDVEGMELQAFKGLDLKTYPFRYLTFEFFPIMLRESGRIDPLELLFYIRDEMGYKCNIDDVVGVSSNEKRKWLEGIGSHINVYCERM